LGLLGRYLYICYKVNKEKTASFHFDFLMKDGNPIRITLTTLTKEERPKGEGDALIPLEASDRWTIYCVDLDYAFKRLRVYPKSNHIRKHDFELTRITLCADSFVRGVYTSDNLYNVSVMPKEINFRKPQKGRWEETYVMKYYPVTNAAESTKHIDRIKNAAELHHKPPKKTEIQPVLIERQESAAESSPTTAVDRTALFRENLEQDTKVTTVSSSVFPKQLLVLDTVAGFTARTCPDIKFSRLSDTKSQFNLFYAAGNQIIYTSAIQQGKQVILQGHKNAVTCMDLSHDGTILASCEEGENPLVRFWNTSTQQCIGKFNISIAEARCMSFNCESLTLCIIGSDKLSRDEILVIEASKKPNSQMLEAKVIARQISEFNILTIKFSPTEPDRLVSCGKENIRFWRIKNQHLPGCAVVLNHNARDTIFTVLDYDFGKTDQPKLAARDDAVKRVLVGSKHGYLYQVSYASKPELLSIIKIHDLSICSISVSAGYCVTGSQDQYIRVWALDFSEFFLEAYYESIVISLDTSMDGLKVACGTSANTLNIVDLKKQNSTTRLSSHCDTITALKYQKANDLLLSLSKDSTIRVWSCSASDRLTQQYEINHSKDDECKSIDIHPDKKFFVGGFQSGSFKYFNIEKTSVESEHRYHNQPIEDTKFSCTGKYLGLGDARGFYSVVNAAKGFELIKTFECSLCSPRRAEQQQDLLRLHSRREVLRDHRSSQLLREPLVPEHPHQALRSQRQRRLHPHLQVQPLAQLRALRAHLRLEGQGLRPREAEGRREARDRPLPRQLHLGPGLHRLAGLPGDRRRGQDAERLGLLDAREETARGSPAVPRTRLPHLLHRLRRRGQPLLRWRQRRHLLLVLQRLRRSLERRRRPAGLLRSTPDSRSTSESSTQSSTSSRTSLRKKQTSASTACTSRSSKTRASSTCRSTSLAATETSKTWTSSTNRPPSRGSRRSKNNTSSDSSKASCLSWPKWPSRRPTASTRRASSG